MEWPWRDEESHQVGTVSGIFTAVYFKNRDNTAAAEPTGEPNCGTYRQTLEERETNYPSACWVERGKGVQQRTVSHTKRMARWTYRQASFLVLHAHVRRGEPHGFDGLV